MFEQLIDAMRTGTPPTIFSHSQQMMECTLRLAKSQSDVMNALYDELGQEFRTMFTSSDPSLLAKNWPQLLSTVFQANTQATALLMQNANEFQREMLQLTQVTGLGLPVQIMKNMMETVKASTHPGQPSSGHASVPARKTA